MKKKSKTQKFGKVKKASCIICRRIKSQFCTK